MAIIPINKASEARAAASWITALNMTSSPGTEREHSSSFVLESSDKWREENRLQTQSVRTVSSGFAA
jgi:hypothetical protein